MESSLKSSPRNPRGGDSLGLSLGFAMNGITTGKMDLSASGAIGSRVDMTEKLLKRLSLCGRMFTRYQQSLSDSVSQTKKLPNGSPLC